MSFPRTAGRREQSRRGFLSTLGLGAAGVGAAVASKLLPGGKVIGDPAPKAAPAPARAPGLAKQQVFKHPLAQERKTDDYYRNEGAILQYMPLLDAHNKHQELMNLPMEGMTRPQMARAVQLAQELKAHPAIRDVLAVEDVVDTAKNEAGAFGDLGDWLSPKALSNEQGDPEYRDYGYKVWRDYGMDDDEVNANFIDDDSIQTFVDRVYDTSSVGRGILNDATTFLDRVKLGATKRKAVEDALRERGIDVDGEVDDLDRADDQLFAVEKED